MATRSTKRTTSSSDKKTPTPKTKDAMDKFKMEVASELGVNLKDGYNGDLSSAEAGRVGGEMVKKMVSKQKSQMTK